MAMTDNDFPTREKMKTLNEGDQKMNFHFICKQLNLENVLCCWLVGSRLWGTATKDSDWDVVFVLPDNQGRSEIFHPFL
jgi:predicted nucleotidyltransferase